MELMSLPGKDLEFPEPTSILTQRHEQLETSWKEGLGCLSGNQRKDYLELVQSTTRRLADGSGPGEWLFYQHFLRGGCLQAMILHHGKPVYYFGIPLKDWKFWDEAGPAPVEGLDSIRVNRKEISIQAVVPSGSAHLIRHMLASELMPVATRILRSDAGRNPENWIDSVEDLSMYLSSRIKRALEKSQPVTISHFLFQDLTRYVEEVGEYWTLEIIDEIRKTIKSNLKKRDTLVSLTPVSHLVLSTGPTEEQIHKRFHHIYFEIRSLILDYTIFAATVETPDYRIADILEKLKL